MQEQFLDGIYTPDFLDEMHDESGSEYEGKHAAPANKKVNQMVSLRWNIPVKNFTVYFLYFKMRRTKSFVRRKKSEKSQIILNVLAKPCTFSCTVLLLPLQDKRKKN